MYQYIDVQFTEGIGRLMLNRPDKRNALRRDFIEEILAGIDQLKSNPQLRVFVLGAAGTVFCAGMDLSEMQQRATAEDGPQQWQKDSEVYGEVLLELFEWDVPTVAAVSGPVLAGGVGLVLACDLVVTSENAFFMLPEPVRGITAAMVTPLLIHRVGAGPASQMLLSNERISAQGAKNMNLCHCVVSTTDFDSRLNAMVSDILQGSPAALAITKQHIRRCLPIDVSEQIRQSVSVSAAARQSADAREGLAAFLQHRKPNWQ